MPITSLRYAFRRICPYDEDRARPALILKYPCSGQYRRPEACARLGALVSVRITRPASSPRGIRLPAVTVWQGVCRCRGGIDSDGNNAGEISVLWLLRELDCLSRHSMPAGVSGTVPVSWRLIHPSSLALRLQRGSVLEAHRFECSGRMAQRSVSQPLCYAAVAGAGSAT